MSNPDAILIAHEVNELARMVSDKTAIAQFINKCHGTSYFASDIEKILLGIKPTNSMPRALRQTKLMVEPITWSPPISTNKSGVDPLAVAVNAYLERNAGKIREALAA